MDTLSDDIQNIIYKYKHQIEFKSVVNELNIIVDRWCDEQLTYRYCKGRHQIIYNRCKNEFKTLKKFHELKHGLAHIGDFKYKKRIHNATENWFDL